MASVPTTPAAPSTPPPAAAPATPAPAAPATPAPVTPTPAIPAAAPPAATPAAEPSQFPSAAAVTQKEGETDAEYLQRKITAGMEDVRKAGEQPAPAAPATPEVKTEGKTPEQVMDDMTKGTEQKTPEQLAAEAAAVDPADAFNFDVENLLEPEGTIGLLSPQDFNKSLDADPALKAALEASPLKNKVFQTLREAAVSNEIRSVFPTKMAAEYAMGQTKQLTDFRETFMGLNDRDNGQTNFQKFMSALANESIVFEDDGKTPMKDATTGRFVTDGNLEAFIDMSGHYWLDRIDDWGKSTGNATVSATVAALRDALKSPSSPAGEELTPELKQRIAQVDSRENEIRQRETQQRTATLVANEKAFQAENETRLQKRIDAIFAKVEIPEFNVATARQKIQAETMQALSQDQTYISQRNYLAQQPQTPEIRKQRAWLFADALQTHMPRVAKPIIKAAGGQAMKAQSDRDAKVTAQVAASKNEPRGATTTPTPAPPETVAAHMEAWNTKWKTDHNGEEPPILEWMKEKRRLTLGA